jgi:pyoverdine/dityrosine biosynthesis protein Dit1
MEQSTTERILTIFEAFRMQPTAIDNYQPAGRAILAEQLLSFISRNETIDFVMLGFPMKSPNSRDKVLGLLPDLGEQVTMENFADFAAQVQQVYAPGINITIVSDGYVFSDIMQVPDKVVALYQEMTQDMARIAPVTWYTARDFYSKHLTIPDVREKVITDFGITSLELERRLLFDPNVNALYRGMIKFMEGDLAIRNYASNSQLHKQSKIVAREMMFRNEAYSNLVSESFPDSIRLSMHNTTNDKKFSFQLIPSKKAWASPWHAAVLVNADGSLETIHRKDADPVTTRVVYKEGRPYNFEAIKF